MATASAPPVIRVGIEEARGLLAGDMNGFSDPYVQLLLLDRHGAAVPGAPTIKTKIRTKTLNPKWAERFVIGDTGVDLRTVTTLRFVVYDWDGYKSDDTLGVVDVPIDDAFQLAEQGNEDWYRVNKLEKQMTKDAKGDLKLQFTRAIPEKLPTQSPTVVVEDGSPNLLYVVIDSGKDLLAMDPNQSSDPFVKLSVTGQSFSTTTIEKTLKPHWDERFAFVVRDIHTTLELMVEDEDRTVNDFLGRAQVVLADVIEAEKEKKIEVKLLNKKLQEDKDRGTLQLRVLWTFDENAESIAKSMKKRKKQEQSIFHQLTTRLHLTVPDAQIDEEELISHLNEEQGILHDESDDEDKLPLPPGAKTVRFASITIHRAEELPPLDALHFEKETHKPSAPGGGIDAYVAAWVSNVPEDFIRTRIHTRKGRRDELSTSFHETLMLALPTEKTPTDVTLAVMDWDSVGGDEVVSHVELKDVEELIKSKEGKPFWWNLYGAPLVGVKSKDAVDKMNKDTTAGSTYRGRILLTLKLTEKPATAYDERHQKRAAKKLPRTLFPPSGVYRLRAHFLTAIGLPEPTDKYYLSLSCGTHEITSTQKAAISRAVEWNETEESDRLVFPLDASQIPDVVLSLCTGEWEKRVIVSYMRFKAADLLAKEFNNTTVEWVPLLDDPTSEIIKKNEFPGKVLLRLGFGSLAAANAQVWDQKSMIDIVNRRVPYQIRVRLQGLKNVAKAGSVDAARKTPVHVRVQCADQESQKSNVVLRVSEAPAVFTLDVNLPQLSHASQVLIHLKESEAKDSAFIGTLAVSLDEAKDLSGVDASGIVTRCTSEQLKKNTRPQAPRAQWLPLIALDDTIESNQLLASVEIIRKTYPDEKLPTAEPEALESP